MKNLQQIKSTSQTPRTLTRNAILLAITALALCVAPHSRGDEACNPQIDSSWIGTIGDWFTATNWCQYVPNAHTLTCITAQITSTDPAAEACETWLGQDNCGNACHNSVNSGNLSVNGGSLTTFSELHVGFNGTGKLTINSGGRVSTTFAADIGAFAGSNGSASVDGNSQWTIAGGGALYVAGTVNGDGGTGLLTVTNGATVTAGSAHVFKSGTLTGNGTVSLGSGSGLATVDGTVAPSGGGTTLTIGGLLQLNSSATTRCNVTPQDPSTTPQVSVSGQVSLGGRLSVTMTGDFSSAPTRFALLNAGSVNSIHFKFDSTSITYPTNQCWTPQIDYVTDNNGQYHVYLDRIVCTN
jgi:T5SS/PEP-CTERM-associated repeat protein